MFVVQVAIHINHRQLNLLMNEKLEDGLQSETEASQAHCSVSNQCFLQSVKDHWLREMLQEVSFQDQLYLGNTEFCIILLDIRNLYTWYLYISILQKFCKIFPNISQSFQNLLTMALLHCQLCSVEFLFSKTCWKMLVPYLISL